MSAVVNKPKQASIKTDEVIEKNHWQLFLLVILFVTTVFVAIKTKRILHIK